ncbi:MAG: hypothetical protein IJ104_01960, partial [Methanobrevibacter sp.]|nr:hypothetical protein [Methanobrevibacter sp.]
MNGGGTRTISAYYIGATGYNPSAEVTKTITVNKEDIELSINVDDVYYPNNPSAVINTNVAGTYDLTVNGNTESIELNSGSNIIPLSNLPVSDNDYTATVSYGETSWYNEASASDTFKVNKNNDYTFALNVNDSTINYGESVRLTPDLSDGVSGTVTYSYSNGTIIDTISSSESLDLSNLKVGTNTIGAEFNNENYTVKTATVNVVVNPIEIKVNITSQRLISKTRIIVTANVDGTYYITFNSLTSSGLLGIALDDKLSQENSYSVNVKDGSGYVDVDLDDGNYELTAAYEKTEGYQVSLNNDELTLASGSGFTIREKNNPTSDDINILPGQSVTVQVYMDRGSSCWPTITYKNTADGSILYSNNPKRITSGTWYDYDPYSFNDVGTYTVQVTYSSWSYESNVLTIHVGEPKPTYSSFTIYDENHIDETKLVFADETSVTLDIHSTLISSDTSASDLQAAVGSSVPVIYVDNEVYVNGHLCYDVIISAADSITLSQGKHVIYYSLSETDDIDAVDSNKLTIFVGEEPVIYDVNITLFDSSGHSLDSNNIIYIDVGQQVDLIANISSKELGSSIGDYLSSGKYAKLSITGVETPYSMELSPKGLEHVGLYTSSLPAGVYEIYVIFDGNDDLAYAKSNTLTYIVHSAVTIDAFFSPS